MLLASLRQLERDIGESESRVRAADRRLSDSLASLRSTAVRTIGLKLAAGAALMGAGWLLHHRRARTARHGEAPARRRRYGRRLPLLQPLMPFLLPLLAPLLDRKVALMLATFGLPIVARAVDPLRTVPALDLAAFSGDWFEVARLPQRRTVSGLHDVNLHYGVDADGTLQVTSRCIDGEGRVHEATGRLRQKDRKLPGELEVSFAPAWLRWWPGVWKDHWVLYADAEYQCALIGSAERDSLRVLTRQPSIPDDALQALLTLAQKQGFDTDRVQRTPHG